MPPQRKRPSAAQRRLVKRQREGTSTQPAADQARSSANEPRRRTADKMSRSPAQGIARSSRRSPITSYFGRVGYLRVVSVVIGAIVVMALLVSALLASNQLPTSLARSVPTVSGAVQNPVATVAASPTP